MSNGESPQSFHHSGLARWHAASRPTDLAALLGTTRTIGIVVPHPDDETLGCGGLVAAAAALGLDVTVTLLTDGDASHPGSRAWPPARLARRRRQEAIEAVAGLTGGAGRVVFAGASDGQLADRPDTARLVPPADLYVTCWRDDPHPDHRAAYGIAETVARSRGVPLLAFPLWVLDTAIAVPDLPLYRLDVSPQLALKRRALTAHSSQLGALDIPGFVLDENLQRLFVRSDELYLRAA
ncbi:PIG-L deacetylase family protein [Polymorphobacter sp.]|uniref:PIG-L deacetylase family protein n=1 Tax=Polymorphobacter sp. TaxID=1909290 RepID=UPI003F6F9CDA